MRSGKEYLEDLKRLNSVIYANGEKVESPAEHPLLRPVINAAAATYDLALENPELMVTGSGLTGEKCNLLTSIITTREDLVRSVKLRRWWQSTIGSCNGGRCAGMCAANAVFNGTYETDRLLGTEYHSRFLDFFREVQKKDRICTAGVMCVKGDRGKGPAGQEDPDMYLRVVEKNNNGIVVRGAKAHQSNGALGHEIVVLPLRVMREDEKDYAVSFAVPNGTKGLIHVWQHNYHDSRRLAARGADLGGGEFGIAYHGTCLTIFDDVFVPWERVFLCGEYQATAHFVEPFADLIRVCGGGCRPGVVDLAIGVMALLAEYNGVPGAAHIIEKLTNLTCLNEVGYGCALAAANEGSHAGSGLFLPHSLYANAARLHGTLTFAEANKWLGDIAGGLIATLPSEKDFENSYLAGFLTKYLRGRHDVSTENRVRALRFAEALGSGPPLHGLICGGGTTETQKMFIKKGMDLERKKGLVRALAGIDRE
ncbi:MAG: 4-hydroxyphenylacetate 3-hydroxylase N-terminal domain-containing protein [Bacillota bacterium]